MVQELFNGDPETKAPAAMEWPGKCAAPVEPPMQENVSTCKPEDEIRAALMTMARHQVRHLQVVDANGAVVGMLSIDHVVLHAEAADLLNEDMLAAIRALWGRRVRPNGQEVELIPPPRAFA